MASQSIEAGSQAVQPAEHAVERVDEPPVPAAVAGVSGGTRRRVRLQQFDRLGFPACMVARLQLRSSRLVKRRAAAQRAAGAVDFEGPAVVERGHDERGTHAFEQVSRCLGAADI